MESAALTLQQILELSGLSEMDVRRDMRRGILPSMEPEVVGEWLRAKWSRTSRYDTEVSDVR